MVCVDTCAGVGYIREFEGSSTAAGKISDQLTAVPFFSLTSHIA